MAIVLLIRHGETDWNRSGRVMGDQPIPLNPTGEQRSREVAAVLARTPLAAIVTSPVLRAKQTADILGAAAATTVHLHEGLSEIGVGVWINRYWRDFAEDPAKRDWYVKPDEARPEGGETLREVQQRAVAAIEATVRPPRQDPLVFVTHADVIRAILSHYLQLDLSVLRQARIDHVSVSGLDLSGSTPHLLFLNHRPGLRSIL
ncbi:MAG TPA: histidine phosphatase family protein [Nitrospiraceae bacterium]|jgi:broad specificity phosphatase PhoE|nr:histidine phosphatase family protein [Nitrospiraceae bacterium]